MKDHGQYTSTTEIKRTEMKNPAILALSLCAVALFAASCKSQESAYRQAYERARAQEMNKPTQTVTIIPQNTQPQPVQPAPVQRPAAPVVQRTVVVEEDNTPRAHHSRREARHRRRAFEGIQRGGG